MVVQAEYDLKFPLYDGIEDNIRSLTGNYNQIHNNLREEGSVNSKVLSYFFEGLLSLTTGDELYWRGDKNEGYSNHQEALKMFTRFRNSRTVETRIDKLNERMIARVSGLIKLQDYELTRDQKLKDKFLNEALELFNQEVSLANEMDETISSYASFSRASYTESRIYSENSKKFMQKNESTEAKKNLFLARYSLRQAAFIDIRYRQQVDNLEGELDDLTKNRLLMKAENMADLATIQSEEGVYQEAKEYFRKAVLFHRRASSLASDTGSRRKLLSSATLYEASMLEAEANQLFKTENKTDLAAIKYEEASKFVDKAIGLMGHFGSNLLRESFICQSNFYKAKSLQTQGIFEFDKENYKVAKDLLDQSSRKFNEAIEMAKQTENNIIVQLGNESIGDNNGYLSIVDALI